VGEGTYWTQAWNPMTGCTPISAGCDHCYARDLLRRFPLLSGSDDYEEKALTVRLHRHRLALPARWKKQRIVFVCNCGDLFHEAVPDEFIWRVFDEMIGEHRHQYLLLTKRAERMAAWVAGALPTVCVDHMRHIWFGATVESAEYEWRLDHLGEIARAGFRTWVSVEPMLSIVWVRRNAWFPDWVTVGAETGPRARECHAGWVDGIEVQCRRVSIPVWVKKHPTNPNPRREMPPELAEVFGSHDT